MPNWGVPNISDMVGAVAKGNPLAAANMGQLALGTRAPNIADMVGAVGRGNPMGAAVMGQRALGVSPAMPMQGQGNQQQWMSSLQNANMGKPMANSMAPQPMQFGQAQQPQSSPNSNLLQTILKALANHAGTLQQPGGGVMGGIGGGDPRAGQIPNLGAPSPMGAPGTQAPIPNLGGMIGNLQPSGGNPIPSQYLTPNGPVENSLFNMFMNGPQGFTYQSNPLVNSLAGGQLPPAIAQQLQNNLNYQNAQLREQYGQGGAGFGSDVATYIARMQGQTLNNAYANAEQQALGANQLQGQIFNTGLGQYLGTGGGLFGAEQTRNQTGLQMLWQEYLNQQGIPPEIQGLLSAGSIGPGTGASTGNISYPGTQGASIAGGIGGLAQLLPFLLKNNSPSGIPSSQSLLSSGAGLL